MLAVLWIAVGALVLFNVITPGPYIVGSIMLALTLLTGQKAFRKQILESTRKKNYQEFDLDHEPDRIME